MNTEPDAVLLRRYADECDEGAFAELVRRHLGLVYRAALRQTNGDVHSAEDVTQIVFTLVARKAATLARHQTFVGWLHTTTRLAARRHQRSKHRRIRREQETYIMHDTVATDFEPADWERLWPLVDAVLADLNDADREAVLLRYFAGLRFAEIGTKLNLTENAARMRVERALDKLHALLTRRGFTSSAAALGAALANEALATAPTGLLANVTSAALSGAALGGGITAGIVFMKTSTAALTVIALAAIVSGIFEFSEASDARAALSAAAHEKASLLAQMRLVQQHARQSEEAEVALKRELELKSSAQASIASEDQKAIPLAAKIEKRGATRIQSVDDHYRALYRVLGFNAEQSSQFKALVAASIRHNEDMLEAAVSQGTQITPSMARGISDETNSELLAAVRATFGDAAAQAMNQYNQTFPARGAVNELADSLFYTDTPLTANQAEQLVGVVSNSARNDQGQIDMGSMVQTDFYASMLAGAPGILSPAQIEALKQLQVQDPAQHGTVVRKGTPNFDR